MAHQVQPPRACLIRQKVAYEIPQHKLARLQLASRLLTCFRFQKPFNSFERSGGVFQLAFPDDKIAPSPLFQGRLCGGVPLLVPQQLRFPILQPRAGHPAFSASGVLMPKTAMNEYDFAPRGEHNVRLSGEISPVEPEPVAKAVDHATNCKLWSRIPAANAAHNGAAAFWRKLFCHCYSLDCQVEWKV